MFSVTPVNRLIQQKLRESLFMFKTVLQTVPRVCTRSLVLYLWERVKV